jgi:hypothetical protein
LRLQPGAITESVTVSAEGSLADTSDATLNGVLSNKAIEEHSGAACLAQATALGTVDNLLYYGCYLQGSAVITPPADMTPGHMGRNIFRGPRFTNWDMSLSKAWKLNERFRLQLRGEFFNILNHANFDVFTMNTDLSTSSTVGTVVYTPDVAAANPVIGSGGSRHIQVAAKVVW